MRLEWKLTIAIASPPIRHGYRNNQPHSARSRSLRIRTVAFTAAILVACAASSSADTVVCYDFNGNTLDSSGLGNNATIVGSPSFVAMNHILGQSECDG